jgi:membrane dipeptidase
VGGVVALLVGTFYAVDPEQFFDATMRGTTVSAEARRIHDAAIVIDLHADTMLWNRDVRVRGNRGHVDFPRLREGGVDAQAFTIATSLAMLPIAIHNRWPVETWTSPRARFLRQIDRFAGMTKGRDDVRIARTAADVRVNAAAGILSVFHGVEEAEALGGELDRLDEMPARGVLFLAPVHMIDNDYGGNSAGDPARGLTALGMQLIERMNELGILLDTAHANGKTLADAVALSAFPPINSHARVKAVYDHWRNLSDDDIRTIAARGGVVGIMQGGIAFSEPSSVDQVIAHMEHVISLVGDEYVALGSDWDGMIQPAVDAVSLPSLTEAMLNRGWSVERIRRVLGENVLRVWAERDHIVAEQAARKEKR